MDNFQHMLVNGNESFVFPSQVQQVFYSDDSSNRWWKVILHKGPWSIRVFPDIVHASNTFSYSFVLMCKKLTRLRCEVGDVECVEINIIMQSKASWTWHVVENWLFRKWPFFPNVSKCTSLGKVFPMLVANSSNNDLVKVF
jgi:hypothetical protein